MTALLKTDDKTAGSSIVDELVTELVERWAHGERPVVEEYLDRHPELRDRPEAALELIAEELALRTEHGEPLDEEALLARFPNWQAQVRVLLHCQRTLENQAPPSRFPDASERIGDFELLNELGRGANGRVFLATQLALAERPVVLKLSPWGGGEHLSLARLQHTHIVPLYSVHAFPDWGLIGLCLPYFGGATLAELLKANAVQRSEPKSRPPGEFLGRSNPWEAVCWVGACLADALQYAHDRGLLHLDVKPSNVLIASDGTPMLLDFHLAHPPMAAGSKAPLRLGGTVGYMPAEQREAMRSVVAGGSVPVALDARADVYSLGLVLTELWESLTNGNRDSIGVADILARCTAVRPEERYPSAGALASDLRRHLMHLSLKGVGNRSFRERWRKWRRRRPSALPLGLILLALVLAGIGLIRHADRRETQARDALRESEERMSAGRYSEAVETCRTGEAMLDGLPFQQTLRTRLTTTRTMAERAQAADELHRLCETVRPFHAAETVTPAQAQEAGRRCRELWDRRLEIADKLRDQPTPELEQQWRADLLDIGILTAHLEVLGASPAEATVAHERALETLQQAESSLGESGVLHLERARHARALGRTALADAEEAKARQIDPRSAWEYLAVGRSHLAAGTVRPALAAIDHSLALDPRSAWGHYYRGVCCLRLKESTEAIASFSACLALNPATSWCVYNRGLAYAQADSLDRAVTDFARAIELDPSFGLAYLARAGVRQRRGLYTNARADLDCAAETGVPRATVEFQKALVALSAEDRPAARTSLRNVLALEPNHAKAKKLLAQLGKE